MSAIFPHEAVVQRYLHTGPRRSRSKVVIAAVVGTLACIVIAIAIPGGSTKTTAEKSTSAEPEKTAPPVQPVAQNAAPVQPVTQPTQKVASADPSPTPPKADVTASAGTSGASTNQPNSMPQQQANVAPPSNPPVSPAPAPQPPIQTVVAQAPAPQPAPQPIAPTADAAAPVNTANDHAADSATPKQVVAKLPRKTGHRVTSAETRHRAARAPRLAAQPTLVRVYDLPDGRRIYQRVRGDEAAYPAGEVRRVYLAPVNRGVD